MYSFCTGPFQRPDIIEQPSRVCQGRAQVDAGLFEQRPSPSIGPHDPPPISP
jgi:hypothetical protein